jgi:hypothetical protein
VNVNSNSGRAGFFILLAILLPVLGVLFHAAFDPDKVIFSNDGPLGVQNATSFRYPEILTGAWFDLNWLGFNGGAAGPNITAAVAMILKPLYYGKFLAPISVLFMGLCAWVFFNQLGLSSGPSVLGALAMALNSNIFSNVCWGLGSRAHGVGMFFLALAVLIPRRTRVFWLRLVLSGLCIGMAVMETGDNGAILSFYLAAFVLCQTWTEPGTAAHRLGKGVLRVAVVAVFAGFIATQGIVSLYIIGIKNASGVSTSSDTVRSKTEQWDWATQWSLPKSELLRVIIPGLYGYRLDTEEGGNYWGAVGRTPGWEQTHAGIPRHSGAGEYAGVLVILIAIWAVAQAGRKEASIFTPVERRWIWFWSVATVISILLAVGRYAPFYRIVYSIPYFSAIRNPMKFMHPAHICFVVLFAYGVQGMLRRYFTSAAPAKVKAVAPPPSKSGWAGLPAFERKWVIGCGIAVGCAVLGWMVYSTSRAELAKHLMEVGFPNEGSMAGIAEGIARFSIAQVGRFAFFLILAVGITLLVIKGTFAGRRTNLGFAVLGLFLVLDLALANRPWIKEVNYKEKYATNPLVEVLRQKPHEHRVTLLHGLGVPRELQLFQAWLQGTWVGDWSQLLFPYFNIQILDVTQLSRRPEEYVQFEENTFALTSLERFKLQDRHWQLTTTPYLLGLAAYSAAVKEHIGIDLKIHSRYTLVLKPGISQARVLDDYIISPKEDGQIALFEVPRTLPRAKLYTQWQVSTNTQETLKTLADKSFDVQSTVLVSESVPATTSAAVTNAGATSAEITKYAPKRMEIKANTDAPAILLVNDKFDPDWKVRVDGRPDKLLRANYVMRGIFLKPGAHTVALSFEPSLKWLYVSLAGIALGVALGLVLLGASLRNRRPNPAA